MTKLRSFLQGKKTYLTGAVAILSGLAAYAGGAPVLDCLDLVLTGVGLGTLRSGVAKLVA